MPSGRYPSVDVVADPVPDDLPFVFEVELLNGYSPEHPARLAITLANRSSTQQRLLLGRIQPFSSLWSQDGGLLVLVPTSDFVRQHGFGTDEQIIPDAPVDGCWRTRLVEFVALDSLTKRRFDAGEYVRTEYALLDYPQREILDANHDEWFGDLPEHDGCLPAGDYQFEDTYHEPPEVPADMHGPRSNAMGDSFTWGFTLTLGE